MGRKKTVALYVRVSTQEQVEGHSISEQTDRMVKYCEAMDWVVINVYTDPGYSGSNMDRPALSRLLDDAGNRLFDMVFVYKLDRLSRSQKDTLFLIEDVFLKNKIEFASMCENFDTSSPVGRAMIGILSAFAQLEREQIRERMAMGHVGRAKEGFWHGGSNAPIGYDFIDGKLVVNEYEALQICEIYDLFLKGNTINGIRDIMQSKYTNRYSSWANTSTVAVILRNSLYIGKIKYKGMEYEGNHEPLIDISTFHEAQNRYNEYQNSFSDSRKSPYKGKHLLSGIVFCANCGARYFVCCNTTKKFGTYYYYKCYSRDGNREMKKMDGCKNKTYRMDILDKLVIAEIEFFAFNPGEIDKLQKKRMPKPDNRFEVIQNRIVEIDKQSNKLMDLYQIDSIPISDIKERLLILQNEKNKLKKELDNCQLSKPLLSAAEAKEIIRGAQDTLENGDVETKRLLINSLISKIVIHDESLEIHWKFTN